jgi:hypothetical protein
MLARLTTFFYNYNQKRKGGLEESWKTMIHSLHSVPFTEYEHLDGINSMAELVSVVQAPTSCPLLSSVEAHQETLACAMSNIYSRSILYIPLEIMLHCKFTGFSLPLPLADVQQDIPQFLTDMSLEEESRRIPFLEAVVEQAKYISGCEDNTTFANFFKECFANEFSPAEALEAAVLKELELHPELYSGFYAFKSTFHDHVCKKQLDLASASGINSACAAISAVLKSVMIYVCPYSSQKFHVMTPVLQSESESLLNKYPMFLIPYYDKGQLLFTCTKYKTSTSADSVSTMSFKNDPNMTTKCACGKGRKTTTCSCTNSRCPCMKSSSPCSELCHCQLCNNTNGRKFQLAHKTKQCRCGENAKVEDKYCVSSLCSCRKFGFSCNDSPACSCKHCCNPDGSRTNSPCPPRKRQATERLMLQKGAGKLPDMNSEQFFNTTRQKCLQSIWNDRENLLLRSLLNFVQITKHHVSPKLVANLYNTYAEKVCEIRKKSTYQVLFKIRHLNANRSVCRS